MSQTPRPPPVDPLPPPITDYGAGEEEPLLGRDRLTQTQIAGQPAPNHLDEEDKPLWYNLITGSAFLAQIGGVALVAAIWTSVFSHKLLVFSGHPLLNSIGIALLLESTLLLQPTYTLGQKRRGAIAHSVLNGTALLLMYSAFVFILVSKIQHHGTHFESAHSILGLTTYTLLVIQGTIGMLQFYFPSVLGGEQNAKAIYKYHRMSGYLIFLFLLSTVVAATYTEYVHDVLKIRTWFVVLTGVFILLGVLPRVDLGKLGYGQQ